MAEGMTPDERDRLVRLEGDVSRLHDDLGDLKAAVKELTAAQQETNRILAEARGGWRALVYIGSGCAAVGGLVTWAVDKLVGQ